MFTYKHWPVVCDALLCSCKAVRWQGHNTFVLGAVQRAPQTQVICNAVWHKLFFSVKSQVCKQWHQY